MRMRKPDDSGFTLIELLVAMSIFVVVGVLAYGGYNNSVKQTEIARASMCARAR